jgi:hypothetical protein
MPRFGLGGDDAIPFVEQNAAIKPTVGNSALSSGIGVTLQTTANFSKPPVESVDAVPTKSLTGIKIRASPPSHCHDCALGTPRYSLDTATSDNQVIFDFGLGLRHFVQGTAFVAIYYDSHICSVRSEFYSLSSSSRDYILPPTNSEVPRGG